MDARFISMICDMEALRAANIVPEGNNLKIICCSLSLPHARGREFVSFSHIITLSVSHSLNNNLINRICLFDFGGGSSVSFSALTEIFH